jgi:hypothetical protein
LKSHSLESNRYSASDVHRLRVGNNNTVWSGKCPLVGDQGRLEEHLIELANSDAFAEINSGILPPHVYVRSIHNIVIERSWLRLRFDWGDAAVVAFEAGMVDPNIAYNKDDPKQL